MGCESSSGGAVGVGMGSPAVGDVVAGSGVMSPSVGAADCPSSVILPSRISFHAHAWKRAS